MTNKNNDDFSKVCERIKKMSEARKRQWEELFPMTVKEIETPTNFKPLVEKEFLSGIRAGAFVSIRPCDKKYEDKTYLGIFLGDAVVGFTVQYDNTKQKLIFREGMRNPAILILSKNAIVYGYESWWGEISTPEDLKEISDQDISDIWYVRALKTLADKQGKK